MEFAKISETKVGTKLKADAGFTCLKEGDIRTVFEIDGELAIRCEDGIHTLDGQYDLHGKDQIVGLYLA